ncbi:MAG TPA: hypothetical protein VFQ91_14300 [Bryobacteraceae bacterium]|nr:hypothetical protein [Bryobacteraceae bacterium]
MRLLIGLAFSVAMLAAEPETLALPRHVLTNDGLVVLARAGLGDGLLVDLIRHKRTQFDTSADALAALARQGMSERVLRAVVEKQEDLHLRKPRITLRPVGQPGEEALVPVEVDEGEVLLMPPAGKKKRPDTDRWYKVSFR